MDAAAHGGDKDIFGDMYEYLLSKLSSAGTNGQFRTPRHIIDFMVRVVDPKKSETILDPACGTGGFLVAAYRYLAGEYTSEKMKKAGSPRAMDELRPAEKTFLYNHMFTGFDSDEDMIKFGMMNLHLHGLTRSRLVRQNTLTDTAGMDDKFDVILANPPFAGKLDEQSVSEDIRMGTKATELLFLRFMLDHLSAKGKFAVIVPEGVVFNTSRAHTKIRQMLLEKGLWCVVSLPSGVFNPYAGVKTSLLFVDQSIAKTKDEIVFIKIQNDGFDLGAQRRPIDQNDIPRRLSLVQQWKAGEEIDDELTIAVNKSEITEQTNYILSGDRYKVNATGAEAKWPLVSLGDVLDYEQPTPYIVKSVEYNDAFKTPVLTAGKTFVLGRTNETKGIFEQGLPVIIFDDFTTATKLVDFPFKVKSSAMKILRARRSDVDIKYVFYAMQNIHFKFDEHKRYWISEYSKIKIPLPPLEIQHQIVAELDGYQKIVSAAKQVVENWKPQIEIDSSWERVSLNEVCDIVSKLIDPQEEQYQTLLHVGGANIESFSGSLHDLKTAKEEQLISAKFLFDESMVLYSKIRPYLVKVVRPNFIGLCSADIYPLKPSKRMLREFLYYMLIGNDFTEYAIQGSDRVGMPKVNRDYLFAYQIRKRDAWDAALPA